MADPTRRKPGPKPGTPKTPEQIAAITTAMPRGERHHNYVGSQVTPKGGRTRAQRMYPSRPCERCGASKAERHHVNGNTADNSPENIRFLCRKCHMTEDGRIDRMQQVRAAVKAPHRGRFTDEDIREMFRLRDEGWTQSRIASRFAVQQSYVSRVLSGLRRTDVEGVARHG